MTDTNNNIQKIDWLPNKKYYEYAYHKFFNPSVKYEEWQPWDQWDYPDRDIERFGAIIKDNKKFISNKTILDIGCHLGYLSLFCLHNNAKHVIGTNVRDNELEIANEICHNAGYTSYEFKYQDLYNLKELKNLCDTVDTVILSGVLYHVHNHYDLLECIFSSSAENVIIETNLSPLEMGENAKHPCIFWNFEESSEPTAGWYKNKEKIFTGCPNSRWIKDIFNHFGIDIEYFNKIEYTNDKEKLRKRLIITGTKNI